MARADLALASYGYHFAPRPFRHYADTSLPAVVMEFIDGTWLGERRMSRAQLESLVEAHQQMYRITPDTSDARFRPATGDAKVMVRRVTEGEWRTDPMGGDALAQEAHALWQTWRKGDDPSLLLEPAHRRSSLGATQTWRTAPGAAGVSELWTSNTAAGVIAR